MYFNGIMPDRIHFTVNTENNNFKSCVNRKINVTNIRISENGTLFVVNKQLTDFSKNGTVFQENYNKHGKKQFLINYKTTTKKSIESKKLIISSLPR